MDDQQNFLNFEDPSSGHGTDQSEPGSGTESAGTHSANPQNTSFRSPDGTAGSSPEEPLSHASAPDPDPFWQATDETPLSEPVRSTPVYQGPSADTTELDSAYTAPIHEPSGNAPGSGSGADAQGPSAGQDPGAAQRSSAAQNPYGEPSAPWTTAGNSEIRYRHTSGTEPDESATTWNGRRPYDANTYGPYGSYYDETGFSSTGRSERGSGSGVSGPAAGSGSGGETNPGPGTGTDTNAGYGTDPYRSGAGAYDAYSYYDQNGAGGGNGGGTGGYSQPGNNSWNNGGNSGSKALNISKKAFILTLILAILVSVLLSFGAFTLYDYVRSNSDDSATNYTLADSKSSLSCSSVIKKTSPSVVSITTESVSTDSWAGNYITQGAGSGVIIQSNGYIITCYHVVADATKITVTLSSGKSYDAKIVGKDYDSEIAVLKIDATGLTAATYGDSSKLSVGEQVVVIGNPLGRLATSASTGIVSALNRNLMLNGRALNLLQTDASVNPGNSGGGMFDSSGNLVGIIVAKSSGSNVEGLGFAIPVNDAAEAAKQIIKTKGDTSTAPDSSSSSSSSSSSGSQSQMSTPKIGIYTRDYTATEAQALNLKDGAGLYIMGFTSTRPQLAGLQRYDKIVAVDSTSISSGTELHTVLAQHKSGDTVRVTVQRSGESVTVSTTLL